MIDALNLSNANGVTTPGVLETIDKTLDVGSEDPSPVLPGAEATAYRGCAARANYLGLDRPDVQYSAKEISRYMSNPHESNVVALKRLARYLKLRPRLVFMFKFQAMPNRLSVYCDSNHAGCLKTRKSTQGGVVMVGNHCIKSWSSTQAIIATSSGEAEYYGIVKASSTGLGIKSMMQDLGIHMSLEVLTDATAAKSMASRKGLGRAARHVEVHYLWVQERVCRGDIIMSKVPGEQNPADLLTKYLDASTIQKYMNIFGMEYREGRSDIAPSLSSIFRFDASALHGLQVSGRKQNKQAATSQCKQVAKWTTEAEVAQLAVYERVDVGPRRFMASVSNGPFWDDVERIVTDLPDHNVLLQDIQINSSNRNNMSFWNRTMPRELVGPDTRVRTRIIAGRDVHVPKVGRP